MFLNEIVSSNLTAVILLFFIHKISVMLLDVSIRFFHSNETSSSDDQLISIPCLKFTPLFLDPRFAYRFQVAIFLLANLLRVQSSISISNSSPLPSFHAIALPVCIITDRLVTRRVLLQEEGDVGY